VVTHSAETPTFLGTGYRSRKPRRQGITHALDKGTPVVALEALMPSVSDFVDVWKFGWGLAYADPEIKSKVEVLRRNGVNACPGGTLLEISWQQDRMEEFFAWTAEVGFPCVEVSSGATGIPAEAKRELIRQARSLGFEVLAEVGSKDPADHATAQQWVDEILADTEAGASWVVAEGRESGTVGIYESDGQIRAELVKEIERSVDRSTIIYEAPRRAQQAWLIRHIGSQVNLGNIAVSDLPSVESLRLGLRTDTIDVSLEAGKRNRDIDRSTTTRYPGST